MFINEMENLIVLIYIHRSFGNETIVLEKVPPRFRLNYIYNRTVYYINMNERFSVMFILFNINTFSVPAT